MPVPFIADNIELRGDMCVIQVIEALTDETAPSQIVLASDVKDKLERDKYVLASVLNTGPGERHLQTGELIDMWVEPGDVVVVTAGISNVAIWLDMPTARFLIRAGECIGKLRGKQLEAVQRKIVEAREAQAATDGDSDAGDGERS